MINMRAKMSGFIFPNVPISDFERAAFERAVNYGDAIVRYYDLKNTSVSGARLWA